MTRHDRRDRLIAVCLASLAGYIDAMGFLTLGGYFVSFMSGNSTRFGVEFIQSPVRAAIPGGLIALFVLGVMIGSVVGRRANSRRKLYVLCLVSALLLAAASCDAAAAPGIAVIAMTLAMGAENAVYERDGEVSIGLTYMTGNLVKLGQHLTSALFFNGDRWAWRWYLLHWSGLVLGAIAGAYVYTRIGLSGLWVAAAAAIMLTTLAYCFERNEPKAL